MDPSSQVSSAFAALIRKRELSLFPGQEQRLAPQLADDIIRPLLDEQLREVVSEFGQLAQPTGSRIVSSQGLDPTLAYYLFESMPVLPEDRAEAEELACDELRRVARLPDPGIFGAALTLCPNGEVTVRPVLSMRMA